MNNNCWTKTKYTRQGLSRGENRVVLKSAPYNGAEGRILSCTKNGWLRVKITRAATSVSAGEIIKVRNNPFYLTQPFVYKVFGTAQMSQWGGRNQASQAWWVPLDGVAQIPTEETADDPIVRRLEALAIPSTPETQCFKCSGKGHWSSECRASASLRSAILRSRSSDAESKHDQLCAQLRAATTAESDSSDGWETVSEDAKDSPLVYRSIADAQIRQERADVLSKQRKWEQHLDAVHFKNRVGRYSWGPQGEMGPQWGSSYTGD